MKKLISENVSAIALAEVEPPVGAYATVAGWGVSSTLDPFLSNYLKKVDVEVASDESAAENFEGKIRLVNLMIRYSSRSLLRSRSGLHQQTLHQNQGWHRFS